MSHQEISAQEVKDAVRKRYARAVEENQSCCGGDCGSAEPGGKLAQLAGYPGNELESLPRSSVEASLGCGNPVGLSEIPQGAVVLDIGSGAGIDCLLAARRVGPEGRVIGLDMTPEMIERAQAAAHEARLDNVEFRRGDAEQIPLPDQSVDWIISNCVINLSPDKPRVFSEIGRVLRAGGRISISDIVLSDDLPDSVVADMRYWTGCISGAIREADYLAGLQAAGLEDVGLAARFVYEDESVRSLIEGCVDVPAEEAIASLSGKLASVVIHGRKKS